MFQMNESVPRKRTVAILALCLGLLSIAASNNAISPRAAEPGSRVLMDAHNCYPYFGWWNDRIDRALSAGTPLAIEQDLLWYTPAGGGSPRSIVTHGSPSTGHEPSLRDYFFERVRPIVEQALRSPDHSDWPLITLNLDLKSEEPEHLAAIWSVLLEYRDWVTTAPRTSTITEMSKLTVKPILVLTGESDAQKAVFYDQVPLGSELMVFGATRTESKDPTAAPATIAPEGADNYHRWWNNPWKVVEPGGQTNAGDWTPIKEARLHDLVSYAHQKKLWIRFYTLDGVSASEESCRGIFHTYNFGSLQSAEIRWRAAARAGVDYLASDQYETLSQVLRGK